MSLSSLYASFDPNQNFPSLKAYSNPKGDQGAAGGGPEASDLINQKGPFSMIIGDFWFIFSTICREWDHIFFSLIRP